MPDAIRKLPAVERRVETGPVQFGDDWPGIFIRGDNALWLCRCIDATLLALKAKPPEDGADWIAVAGLQGLRNTLAGCDLTGSTAPNAGVPGARETSDGKE